MSNGIEVAFCFFKCVKDELIVIDDVAKIVPDGTVVSSACHAKIIPTPVDNLCTWIL